VAVKFLKTETTAKLKSPFIDKMKSIEFLRMIGQIKIPIHDLDRQGLL
jgi:hypothetical protein